MRCIAKSPDQRPSSMDELLLALKAISGGAAAGYTGEWASAQLKLASYPPPPAGSTQQAQILSSRRPLASQSSGPINAVGSQQVAAARPSSSEAISLTRARSSRSVFLLAITLVALCVVGVVGFVAWKQQQPRPISNATSSSDTATSSTSAPVATTAPIAPTTNAAPAPSMVKIRVDSDPPGSSVRENGVEICAATPCDIVYSGEDAEPIKEHRLTFFKSGFRPDTRSVRVADAPIHVKLARAPGGRLPATATSGTKPEASAEGLKGFKETPY